MVLKRCSGCYRSIVVFENDVKMYGTQTCNSKIAYNRTFENDVKMYGTQTVRTSWQINKKFENDVKMYGTQTTQKVLDLQVRLRMM